CLHFHGVSKFPDGKLLGKRNFLNLRFLLFLLRLGRRLLQSLRQSGHSPAASLVRSVTAACHLVDIFLFIFILSVALSFTVLGSFCKFRCKYSLVIASSSALALTAP